MAQLERTSTPVFKQCSHCKAEKPLTYFYNNRSYPDGLSHDCKPCHNEASLPSVLRYMRSHKEHHANHERKRYHRIQDEAGCHIKVPSFYPGYRFLKALEIAEVVDV